MSHRRFAPFALFAVVAALGFSGCQKPVVKDGMGVKINYTLTVDGAVIDSSQGKPPLFYVQGAKMIIPGLEEQLAGLKVGDKKHVTVSPEKGYGLINPKATHKVPASTFPNKKELKVGMTVNGMNNGRPIQAKVLAIGSKEITLDLNHPLAGKTLEFDIEIVEIKPAPKPQEEAAPNPAGDPAQK